MQEPASQTVLSYPVPPVSCRHRVQFYGNVDRPLVEGVCQYLREGLARGEGILVIAGPEHRRAFLRRLEERGIDADLLLREGIAAFPDAAECLALILQDGNPDAAHFDKVAGGLARRVLDRSPRRFLRAYGEMVGTLWNQGRRAAAVRLEELWNALLARLDFELVCGCPIDLFGPEFAAADGVFATHAAVLPSDGEGTLPRALERALAETLGNKLASLRAWMRSDGHPGWAAMPRAKAEILWLRTNLPGSASEILDRARRYYCAALEEPAHSSGPDSETGIS